MWPHCPAPLCVRVTQFPSDIFVCVCLCQDFVLVFLAPLSIFFINTYLLLLYYLYGSDQIGQTAIFHISRLKLEIIMATIWQPDSMGDISNDRRLFFRKSSNLFTAAAHCTSSNSNSTTHTSTSIRIYPYLIMCLQSKFFQLQRIKNTS